MIPLFVITLLTYYLSVNNHFQYKKYLVLVSISLLIILNWARLIPTLVGSVDEETVNDYSLLFIGFPFYILSATAFVSEYSGNKINKPPAFIDCALFLSLPFKLLSGPLDSPSIIKQFKNIGIIPSTSRLIIGFTWITLGLFMKFVIGNRLQPQNLVDSVDPIISIICALIFELKFYFDFAGYSFIAYGMAKWCNLNIICNFNHPFTASNIVHFWRCWHISLGQFLKKNILLNFINDFKTRTSKAYLVSFIFIVSAMWHGGTFNYLLWGVFHGVIYFIYIQYIKHTRVPKILAILGMLCVFIFGRMLAIDPNIERLILKIGNIFNITYYFNGVDWRFIQESLFYLNYKALYLATIFITLEFYQVKKQGKNFYHLFRRPLPTLLMFLIFLFFGINSRELLYARI
jgi:D-alanyl-lipoteichoic acid acyltransferase DltB (MBOAT superfamily)